MKTLPRTNRTGISRLSLQEKFCDVDLVDLTRSLIKAEQPHVSVEALDRIGDVAAVAGAAEDLHHPVGDPAAHLRGEVLAHGNFQGDVSTLVALARGVKDERSCGLDLDLAIGEHRLHQLEVGDWTLKLRARTRVAQGFVEQPDR